MATTTIPAKEARKGMSPFMIVMSINLAMFAIWGLFFVFVVNRPELIPLFTSIQAAFNLLGAGVFYLDRKNKIALSFLIGVALVVAVTIVGYLLLQKYRYLIGFEEGFTTQVISSLPPSPLA
ncbi:MAG: hypothetical protein U0176_03010 [Bacteroidia bacterium]